MRLAALSLMLLAMAGVAFAQQRPPAKPAQPAAKPAPKSPFTPPAFKITIATEGAYPPFNYLDRKGIPAGFEMELAQEACQRIKDETGTDWNFDAFFKELKNTYIPVNHIHDQMEEWHAIKQSAPGQSKAIKDIAIQIQQLADEIDDGNTIGWKQRIIHLLEAMRPELRLKVEPEVDLSKNKYDQKDYTSIAQTAAKHD
jgi:ABC-type amino acid transport substrate-binding protein